MRKFIMMLSVLAFIALSCGDVAAQFATSNLKRGKTYVELTTDITMTNAVAQYWHINAAQNWYTAQEIIISLATIAGSHTLMTIQLSGRLTDLDAWTTVGSAKVWYNTTSDTVIVYSVSTENKWRQFKVNYVGTATGTTKIDNQVFKQYFGAP